MVEAFVLINCDMGKENDVVEHLRAIKNIKEAQATIGAYDIVAKIESGSEKEIKDVMDSEIEKIEPVDFVLMVQSN